MKEFLNKYWPILGILILSFFIIWPLFNNNYFSHHDNLQIIRIFEMRRCLEDLQIPCRWVPDMGFGYGFPLFNYYGVLPYYIGGFLSFVLGYIGAAKALFLISLVLGGVSMYLLGKEVFGKEAGFLAGVLYLFSPYRALDLYVRGAIAESFAISLIPLVFYFSLKLIRNCNRKNFVFTSFSLAAFLLCHNIMTLFFIPIFFGWLVLWMYLEKIRNVKFIVLSIILGFGMVSFFIIPAYLEKNLVQIENLKQSEFIPNFRAHFVTVHQLFYDRSWGYGASTWLEEDGISFQVGWPHWWLGALTIILILLKSTWEENKNAFLEKKFLVIVLLIIISFGSLFMAHNKSAFIWERLEMLQFAQFPWRFLSVGIFGFSLAGGALAIFFPGRLQILGVILISIVVVWLNWSYFKPGSFYPLTDLQALSGRFWEFQQQGSIVDYLPLNAKEPKVIAPKKPQVINGEARIDRFELKSNYWKFNISVEKSSNVVIPVFDYPNWRVYKDGKEMTHFYDSLGAIKLELKEGSYLIEGKFTDTLIRTLSNLTTVFSLVILLLVVRKFKRLNEIFNK